MNIAIIAEYNPFHNGHKYHISKTRQLYNAEYITVVMSGNFMQRGEPAIMDKFKRAKAALLNGADLVLELPSIYSCGSADVFALGAADLLNKTCIVDCLCFGSELGKTDIFEKAADILCAESKKFKTLLGNFLSKGISYPNARLSALSEVMGEDLSFLKFPNNILALEYIRALKMTESKIKPLTVLRYSSEFHSTDIKTEISSAAAIRKAMYNKDIEAVFKSVPKNTYDLFKNNNLPSINNYSSILKYILKTKPLSEIAEIADITEGLENRILKFSDLDSISEMAAAIKTKRYTLTKIQRALIHIILDIKKSDIDFKKANPYIRVLGFKKESSILLSSLIKNSDVPVLTNLKNAQKLLNKEAMLFFKREIKNNDIYNLFSAKEAYEDYRHPLAIV